MVELNFDKLDYVEADMAYTAAMTGEAIVRAFPPASGRKIESPKRERVRTPVYDCRPIATDLTLDVAGFELATAPSSFDNFYDPDDVRENYYPETAALLKHATGAKAVFIFDHNVRNKPRSERKEVGVREPVDGAHNDYTLESGPRRIREVLEENHASEYIDRRCAVINVWRPIRGPVQDHPLAICDARTTRLDDFIPTRIEHYMEDDLETPRLTGQIYSFQHSDLHRWFYASNMQPNEVLFLKCFDTAKDGRACFTGHTGFKNPACPENYIPRESIEARTVVVF